MKNRIKALFLAAGLAVSMFGTCARAEAVTEEAVTEASSEAADGEAEEAAGEAAEAESQLAEDAQETETAQESQGMYADYYESIEASIVQTLETLSSMSDEQIQQIIENGTNASEVAMAANWDGVREELGNFVEVTDQQVTEDGNSITVASQAVYDGVDEDTAVEVMYQFNLTDGSATLEWNVEYPISTLMSQAAMNTVMGLGVVFVVLIFLTFVIGQVHWIPDMLGGKEKEKAAAQAAAPVPAAVPAPVSEPEELVDDLELVAVITAAIAASQQTSTDGFVVRSIKKANRRKWLNA